MNSISEIRAELDGIDDKIADLFRRRMEIVDDVASAKSVTGRGIDDPERERQIVERVARRVGPEFADAARSLYSTLFALSKERQRDRMRSGMAPAAPASQES